MTRAPLARPRVWPEPQEVPNVHTVQPTPTRPSERRQPTLDRFTAPQDRRFTADAALGARSPKVARLLALTSEDAR